METPCGWQGSTALHAAAYKGYLPVLQSLLRAGASCDLRDSDGELALDWASDAAAIALLEGQTFHPRVLSSLLDAGELFPPATTFLTLP